MTINDKIYQNERELYNSNNLKLINCKFQGKADGESPLKESKNISLENCLVDLRYPFWHNLNIDITNCNLTINCRASLWYTKNIKIKDTLIDGIKAIRECSNIQILNTKINSPEFLWKSKNIEINNCSLISEYAFLESKNIQISNLTFQGKYSFQYTKNIKIVNSNLDTKDCFWHCKNAVIKDCVIKGEYLAWYSNNLTFINCKIIGTQPFCYCKNLKLINCEMIDADLAFEYSNIKAKLIGDIESIKNPRSGYIFVNNVNNLILTSNSKYKNRCKIHYNKCNNLTK